MIARLDTLSAAQYRMPDHHPLIIARRHQKHADDRQEYGHPSSIVATLTRNHAALETLCQYRISNFVEDFDDLLLLDIGEFHFALVVMPVFMWGGRMSRIIARLCFRCHGRAFLIGSEFGGKFRIPAQS